MLSWKNGTKEFCRLIARTIKCDKHATCDTLSLSEAQQLIRKLSRPIGEIVILIQENLQLAKQSRKNITTNRISTPQFLQQKDAEVIPHKYPQTVCTHDKCIQVIISDGERKIDYKSQCHRKCHDIVAVEEQVVGYPRLKDCSVMDETEGKLDRLQA